MTEKIPVKVVLQGPWDKSVEVANIEPERLSEILMDEEARPNDPEQVDAALHLIANLGG